MCLGGGGGGGRAWREVTLSASINTKGVISKVKLLNTNKQYIYMQ